MSDSRLIVCAVNIGYSNVKIATGEANDTILDMSIYPADATTELEDVKRNRDKEVCVYPNGNMWLAFTEQPDGREFHDNDHMTEIYLALYFGALAKISKKVRTETDLLVTGLLICLAQNEGKCSKLTACLIGVFVINSKLIVTVKKVMVLPPGIGVINDITNRDGLITEDELVPLLKRAVPQLASDVVKESRKNPRSLGAIHVISAAGGGEAFYGNVIHKAFPHKIVSSPNPVASNAIGFWNYGVDAMFYGDK
ncbi:ParM/StbA family protein [Photorhabdus luminescens]|uniref:Rod shape-determining protein MreD n=1 Tax=Photorhabdus luminescens subsp. mexicana TaxID=2100167 RepID=A0A4R4IX93_PHOLU|nr:rod shape-determining protein MreD [Photorhabdus luminescens]TDB45578.1 rod shape-determining protein MreD [Photorhabdus luminescens subsp. mexicana]